MTQRNAEFQSYANKWQQAKRASQDLIFFQGLQREKREVVIGSKLV